MLSQLRNSIITKAFWGLMGLYLLNISVDSSDFYPNHIPEDLTFNDQESVIEIIVEQVLGYEDAIKEYDDSDKEDHNTKTNVKIDLTSQETSYSSISKQSIIKTKKPKFIDYNMLLADGFQKLDFPPPKI